MVVMGDSVSVLNATELCSGNAFILCVSYHNY